MKRQLSFIVETAFLNISKPETQKVETNTKRNEVKKNSPKNDQHKEIVALEMFPLFQLQPWFQLLTKSNFLNLEPVYIPEKIVSGN